MLPWVLLVAAAGCGSSDRAAVSGRVTLDGKPVEDGTISFIPTGSPAGPSACGNIKAGDYAIPARQGPAPGTNRVEIHWSRRTGRKTTYDPKMDEYEEAIPPQYHRDSKLQADLKPGSNQVDYPLTSK